jgi:hypothetical protein
MVLLACALLAWPSRAAAQSPIARGQRWSQTVTSNVSYANAWLSTRVCVQYTAPVSGKLYTGLGYWDQPLSSTSDQFQIRAAFNETGLWSWTLIDGTGCAPTTSFNTPISGTVNVTNDSTGLALYALGPVRLSSSIGLANRFLVYSGAGTLTPFVWIGDTSWSGPYLSFLSSWQNYTANRQSKGFTVIQTAAPLAPTTDVTGRPAFVSTAGGTTACAAGTVLPSSACWPNKAYWDYWDSHVNDVNVKGMLAVVVGLFKRVDGSTAWPTVADSQGYARWIAARLAGNYTALSPGFDELPGRSKTFTEAGCGGTSGSAVNQACRARQVGTAIREAILLNTTINASPRAGDPLTALVTHHMGGGCSDGLDGAPPNQCLADYWLAQFQNESWLDFQLFQSGQGDNCVAPKTQVVCLTERARQRPRTLYDTAPTKPLIDGEAIYDQFSSPSALYSDVRARQTAFYSWLSGAPGFTHGVAGTWDWNGYFTGHSVNDSLTAPSSTQIGAIGQLFAPFRWNRLVPDCQPWTSTCSHIKNSDQATLSPERLRVYARDSNGLFAVAFLPDNSSIQLDLSDLASFSTALGAPWSTEWFDPSRSCYCTATASGSGPYTFNRPKTTGDWALVIRNTNTFPPPANRTLCNPPSGSTISCN